MRADGRPLWRIVLLAVMLGGAFGWAAMPAAKAATGGPDAYGYLWVDSRAPSPTFPYSWMDVLARGVRLSFSDSDGCTFEVPIGFNFRYYGTLMDSLFICANGFVTFAFPDSAFPDPPIPSPAAPNNRIIGLGVDLDPLLGTGGVYFLSDPTATPKRFIVTWNGVYVEATTRPETFQIILEQNDPTKDGRVILQYKAMNGLTAPLVGIENGTGSSGLAYPGPIGNNLAVAFLPPSDQGLPPDRLKVAPGTLAPPSVSQGSANVGMARLDLTTTANAVDVAAIRVAVSGLGAPAQDVSAVRLWLDDGDGAYVPGNDTMIATATVGGVPPSANLQIVPPLRVTVGPPRRVFIAYDLGSSATPGDWVGAALPDASSVSVAYPDLVDPSTFPFDTYTPSVRTRVDASADILRLAAVLPRAPGEAAQWQADVPALELRFEADRNSVDLAGLRVALGGNATAGDVWAAKLLRDANADGDYTPGTDVVLAISVPSGTPPIATFAFSLTVAAGTPEFLLLLIDVAPVAVVGDALNLTVNVADVSLPAGSVDVLSATNYPAASGVVNITVGARPALVLPWMARAPTADGVWRVGEYLLGPPNTAALDRPAGNRVPGFLTASNNATTLFLAVDAIRDFTLDPTEGVAVGFDTDANGIATPGGDDVFVVNTTGGARLQYDGAAGGWTPVSACGPWTGDPAIPACRTGVGVTSSQSAPHRFFELSVPLALVNVTLPLAPGTRLRFALGAFPHVGLADGGNRSTWPLLFGPLPAPLADFGDLVLAPGPAPNRAPTLNWTGEPGYATDGVDPDAGLPNTTFEWHVTYADPDGDAPAVGEPLLHVFRAGLELPASPYPMASNGSKLVNYRTGVIYRASLGGLPCGAPYTYGVTVGDARGLANATGVLPGPQVLCPDFPPVLAGASVTPLVDQVGARFTYRVIYSDPENRTPLQIIAFVQRGSVDVGNFTPTLAGWIADPLNFTAGAWYQGSLVLTLPGFNYSYRFRTSDGNSTVDSEWTFGPYVLVPPPRPLSVAGLDIAPLQVDAGTGMVPFLNLFFITSSAGVNITSIRVDRTGSSADAEVDRIAMYEDVDGNGGFSTGDQFLGARPPLGGAATFSVDLTVGPGRSVSVLLFVNVSNTVTADDTIGLEVRDASSITVAPGSVVQGFAPLRSTAALLNVPPDAPTLTANGYPNGSPGILHIVGAAPTFSWTYRDANAADLMQVGFNISVSAVAPPGLLWFRNETGTDASATYGGPALTLGAMYRLAASTFDGRRWSPVTVVSFRVNTPPPAPTPFAPPDLAAGIGVNTTILWNPVSDAEGDSIAYWFWVSRDVGFANPIWGTTASPGASVSLAPGVTYYWKVAASDGWEVRGNTTVWQFTTVTSASQLLGEVRGRVLNGTAPLPDALVELLVNGSVRWAALTPGNGTFRFRNLDFLSYTVRVSAFGFKVRTLTAAPTRANTLVDLHDISLDRAVVDRPPDDGGRIAGLPLWVFLIFVALTGATIATGGIAAALAGRRRREDRAEESIGPASDGRTASTPSAAQGRAPVGSRVPPTSAGLNAARTPPKGPSVPPAVAYECPVCGRRVASAATRCICGAVFEA